jgi:cyclopropane-fatty-acyl-phospholipid synthase
MNTSIIELLAENGIYGPGSPELEKYERHLTRYFEREYRRLQEMPTTIELNDIYNASNVMMDDTKALMEQHYDERPEFFTTFLDNDYHAYSMAYYGETPEIIRQSSATLEDAQRAKIDLITERAQIKGDERILNIGCGFGSLETYLLSKHPNLRIFGVTPSKVQAKYLEDRMQNPHDPLGQGNFEIIFGPLDKVKQDICDKGNYNLVISIGVLEHTQDLVKTLKFFDSVLTDHGRSFHHFITSKIVIPKFLESSKTKIGDFFPSGKIWPHGIFLSSNNTLPVSSWFLNGLNYWRTLDEWHSRYWKNTAHLMKNGFDIKTIAHWNNYFSLCKVLFAPQDGHFYGNSQYLFTKSFRN